MRENKILQDKIDNAIEVSIDAALKTVETAPRLYNNRTVLKMALKEFGETFKAEINSITREEEMHMIRTEEIEVANTLPYALKFI
jgi:hypothetical protein